MEDIKGQLKGICFFVTSTFGNGTHPTSAKSMAEWLDAKLNDSEDNVYERLNTIIHTEELSSENDQTSKIREIITEEGSSSESMTIKEGKLPPLLKRRSTMKLGVLPSRKSSLEQDQIKTTKTLSRRISMATVKPIDSHFSKLR